MARGEIGLQPLEHPPALHVGQVDIERQHRGLVLADHGERRGAGRRDQRLEALLPRGIEQDLGEAQIVLDDQQHAVAGLDLVAIIAHLVDEDRRFLVGLNRRQRLDGLDDFGLHRRRRRRWRSRTRSTRGRVHPRQVQREDAAGPRGAHQLDVAAQQLGQFARNREAEARAAVFA